MKDSARSADGVDVHFDVDGDGAPALVFVHGWSCDRTYWRYQLEHFAERHRVIAIDLAGHGESGAERRAWTMPAFGEDVVAVVEQLRLDELVLVGHSMGGDVIVEAALRLPDQTRGLVWVDVYSRLGHIRTPEETAAFMEPFRRDFVTAARDFVRTRLFTPDADPELVAWVAADMSAAPVDVAVDAIEHAITNDAAILAGLAELRAPLVAINPDHRPTDVEGLRRHGVEVVLLSGVAHFPMLEDPTSFNRALDETVRRYSASS